MEQIVSGEQVLFGIILAVLIAVVAWRIGALAGNGAWAAAILGSFIFGLGGLPWGTLLLTFFISSSALSKLFAQRKAQLAEKFDKGSRRDWGQVFANGGVGIFLVLVQLLYPDKLWPWLAYAGAMATVNGDTWATELGVLSPILPRLITTGGVVERGTSGGVTLAGSAATLGGAALIGLAGWSFTPQLPWLATAGVVALSGFVGAFIDSLLGASVQAIYYDPVRLKETERQVVLEDGRPAEPVRGWDWMNNDMVNFLSSIFGAGMAVGLWNLINN